MSGPQVKKYRVTFELELYGASPGEVYRRTLNLLEVIAGRHRRLHMPAFFDEQGEFPTGGVEGEPHGESLDGWSCLFSVSEADS